MRVLVTNDDGIDSPGLKALADMAAQRGHDVLVAAPGWDASGASASVTGVSQTGELITESRSWEGWEEGAVLSLDATPALIVFHALHERLGERPDFVLSGINRGANTGRTILHSGTVGAALTAYQQDCSALAVSSAVQDMATSAPVHWETAVDVAALVFEWLTETGQYAVLNCNVPDVPIEEVLGIRVGGLAHVGAAQTSVTEEQGKALKVTLGGSDESAEVESDAALVQKGFAAVTALRPVVQDLSIDLTGLPEGIRPTLTPR